MDKSCPSLLIAQFPFAGLAFKECQEMGIRVGGQKKRKYIVRLLFIIGKDTEWLFRFPNQMRQYFHQFLPIHDRKSSLVAHSFASKILQAASLDIIKISGNFFLLEIEREMYSRFSTQLLQ